MMLALLFSLRKTEPRFVAGEIEVDKLLCCALPWFDVRVCAELECAVVEWRLFACLRLMNAGEGQAAKFTTVRIRISLVWQELG